MSQLAINMGIDQLCREGVEYLAPFWEVIVAYHRMIELEFELERGKLAEEMNEFHRRVVDCDRPGRRHMLPVRWVQTVDPKGNRTRMPVPITFNSPAYHQRMDAYKARMAELKKRTPNYGRQVQQMGKG